MSNFVSCELYLVRNDPYPFFDTHGYPLDRWKEDRVDGGRFLLFLLESGRGFYESFPPYCKTCRVDVSSVFGKCTTDQDRFRYVSSMATMILWC